MKNKKHLIILISLLIFLIIALLIIINKLEKNQEEINYVKEENPELTTTLNVKKLNNETEFFTVEECVNTYFKILNNNDANGVYSLLNNDYIENERINNSNVLQKTYKLKNGFENFFAKDIYYKEISYDTEYQYYVYGELLGENYTTIKTVYVIANLDFENMSFNISFDENIEINEQEYLNIIEELKRNNTNEFIYVKDQNITSIESNDYNQFEENISDDPYALDRYLRNYSIMSLYYPEIAYNLLDQEYKNKRFNTIEKYKEYVLGNKNELQNITIKEYSISEKEGYYQYVITDTNENYYIFKVTDIMKYTVILDFYTLDLEEITNQYNKSTTQEKVAINIQKIVAAINAKDYEYIYSKLSKGFKKNYYKTIEDFSNFMDSNFLGNVQIVFKEFYNEGSTYIYNVSLQGNRASDGPAINMQIIMQLNENNDFIMSFNIK